MGQESQARGGWAGPPHAAAPGLPICLTPASPERDPMKGSEAALRLLTRRPLPALTLPPRNATGGA